MRFILFAAGMMLLAFTASATQAGSEIAIAMRYLQAEGTSHAQLYLFREDGKLIRQLTHFKLGQVYNPVFSPDGTIIVFKLVKDSPYVAYAYSDTYPVFFKEVKGKGVGYWSVEPRGGNLHKLNAAPDWYATAKDSPYFTNVEPIPAGAVKVFGAKIDDANGKYPTPDGRQELVLESPADDPDADVDFAGHGKHFLLRDLKTKESVELGNVKGFFGLFELLYINDKTDDVFLIDQPPRLAFFAIHIDSSEGDTVFALDLTLPRLVRLS